MGFTFFDSEPVKGKYVDDVVARARSGYSVKGRPVALTEWRFTSGDPDVLETLSGMFGGEASEWETEKEDNLQIFTDANSIDIVIDDSSKLRTQMLMFGRSGPPIRVCNGSTQQDGKACECPLALEERKDASKTGRGCSPSVQLTFRLAAAPDLGLFRFQSGSWGLAGDANRIEKQLEKIDGPAAATLALEAVVTRAGKSFTVPRIVVKGRA